MLKNEEIESKLKELHIYCSQLNDMFITFVDMLIDNKYLNISKLEMQQIFSEKLEAIYGASKGGCLIESYNCEDN